MRARSRIANGLAISVQISLFGFSHGEHQFFHGRGPIELNLFNLSIYVK
jgi:hypothetical protein